MLLLMLKVHFDFHRCKVITSYHSRLVISVKNSKLCQDAATRRNQDQCQKHFGCQHPDEPPHGPDIVPIHDNQFDFY